MTNEDTDIIGCVKRNVKSFVTHDTTLDTDGFRNYLVDKDLRGVDSREICVKILDMDTDKLLHKLDAALAQLTSIRDEIALQGTKYPASIAAESGAGVCHSCKKPLGKGKAIRGCHEACHQAMFREMKDGSVTEQALIAAGRIGPRKPGGRKKKRNFADLLATQQAAKAEADAIAAQAQQKQSRKGAKKS